MLGFSQTDIWWYHLGKYHEKDIDIGKLLVFGALITMFLAVCGFFLILMSKDKKKKGK